MSPHPFVLSLSKHLSFGPPFDELGTKWKRIDASSGTPGPTLFPRSHRSVLLSPFVSSVVEKPAPWSATRGSSARVPHPPGQKPNTEHPPVNPDVFRVPPGSKLIADRLKAMKSVYRGPRNTSGVTNDGWAGKPGSLLRSKRTGGRGATQIRIGQAREPSTTQSHPQTRPQAASAGCVVQPSRGIVIERLPDRSTRVTNMFRPSI